MKKFIQISKLKRLFIILFLLFFYILISAFFYVDAVSSDISNSVFRLHVIANSDSKEDQELEGMGTTIEVVLAYNDRVYIGHIGDSRIYRIRKNIIRKLTVDDSYVQKLVKDGTITKEEAKHHPKKNMLMKALGCTSFVEPIVAVKGFLEDDVIVITSDGLTNMVSDEEMLAIIENNVEKASDELIKKANEAGGLDNITVVIVSKR